MTSEEAKEIAAAVLQRANIRQWPPGGVIEELLIELDARSLLHRVSCVQCRGQGNYLHEGELVECVRCASTGREPL